jgi:hypothetical protein
MSEFLLYGMDDTGQTAHSEVLRDVGREHVRAVAADLLVHWAAVEAWEGPMCILRLRRRPPAAG